MTGSYTKNNENYISWMSVNNIFPIVITIVGMTLTYGLLLTRLAVLETKMDLVLANQEKVTASLIKQNAADVALEIRLTALETASNLRK